MRCGLWLLCFCASLWGRTVDLSHFNEGSTSLAGEWKFHAGDDPQGADPGVDASGWRSVKVPGSLSEQGYRNFSGYGWYRIELNCRQAVDLALLSGSINDAGEVFANGTSIGRFGSFPPHARIYSPRAVRFDIPHSRWSHEGHLVLAMRIWADPRFIAGRKSGLTGEPPLIGTPPVIEAKLNALQYTGWLPRLLPFVLACTELVVSLYLVVLCLSHNRRPEYIWFAVAFCSEAVYSVVGWTALDTTLLTYPQMLFSMYLLQPVLYATIIFGLWSVYRAPVAGWTKSLLILLVCASVFDIVAFQTGHWQWIRYANNQSDPRVMLDLAACCAIVVFLVRSVRSGFAGARWLAISYGAFALYQLTSNALKLVALYRPTISQQTLRPWRDLSFLGAVLGVGYLLMRRFGEAQAEGERLYGEMKAAQEIQSLLLPSYLPSSAGFDVGTAYLPAQEVGGDFFQVAAAPDDGLLLAVGDVSGKGLRAALTVSLVVGLWKEIAAATPSPAEILTRLNTQLVGSVKAGFVTCLCARLGSDGSLTIANAGHLAPYLNGREIALQNGLPLGITAESDYNESSHLLSVSDTLVCISDGVVEARNQARSFYGFDRLQNALAERPDAAGIARSAQQFGQEDDITVIVISRKPVEAGRTPQPLVAPMAV